MIKYVYICDKCGKQEISDNYSAPSLWNQLKYEARQYETFTKLLCPDCSKSLKIEKKENQTNESYNKTVGDRLFEIIQEIVQGETQ